MFEARCVRRAAGVRRDVAVAGRGAGRHARAAARAGAARRAATQVTACRCCLHVAVLRARAPRDAAPPALAHLLPRAFASPLHAYAPVYYDPFLAAAATADSNYRLQAAKPAVEVNHHVFSARFRYVTIICLLSLSNSCFTALVPTSLKKSLWSVCWDLVALSFIRLAPDKTPQRKVHCLW
ncbi:unnamed protein product [Parnassius apollo]|uniref:(apollo) hypothetical protein n=1 Tax=Parnassius apollo TaxID=110799 RepID=A0A8S3WU59_PARAO|nr:unnamed protein product [Parnassius apollo]